MNDYHQPLCPGKKYHIVSRAIGNEKLFRCDKNYDFFLSRYDKHISAIAETYCYSLLPNHFHFLASMKDESHIRSYYEQVTQKSYSIDIASRFLMQQFSNLLNSYTKAFNKMFNRKGGLFIDYLRRFTIESDEQLRATIFYVHRNAVHHGYCNKLEKWPWSSYNTIIADIPTSLKRDEVLNCFGGLAGFLEYHGRPILKK